LIAFFTVIVLIVPNNAVNNAARKPNQGQRNERTMSKIDTKKNRGDIQKKLKNGKKQAGIILKPVGRLY